MSPFFTFPLYKFAVYSFPASTTPFTLTQKWGQAAARRSLTKPLIIKIEASSPPQLHYRSVNKFHHCPSRLFCTNWIFSFFNVHNQMMCSFHTISHIFINDMDSQITSINLFRNIAENYSRKIRFYLIFHRFFTREDQGDGHTIIAHRRQFVLTDFRYTWFDPWTRRYWIRSPAWKSLLVSPVSGRLSDCVASSS